MSLILDTSYYSLIKYSEQTVLLELPGEFQRTLQPIRFKYSLRPSDCILICANGRYTQSRCFSLYLVVKYTTL